MIECIKFKSHVKGHLQGFADFYVEKWGAELTGCSLYMKDGRRWVNLPSKEYKNDLGETKYAPIIRFRKKEHFEAFVNACKKAIDEFCSKNQEPEQEYGVSPASSFDDSECPF